MRNIREILRLKHAGGLSIRQIHRSTKVSVGAVQKLLSKADELGLSWPLPDDLDDAELARCFYPKADTRVSERFQQSDWPLMHQELKRKGMTKQLLWECLQNTIMEQGLHGGVVALIPALGVTGDANKKPHNIGASNIQCLCSARGMVRGAIM